MGFRSRGNKEIRRKHMAHAFGREEIEIRHVKDVKDAEVDACQGNVSGRWNGIYTIPLWSRIEENTEKKAI